MFMFFSCALNMFNTIEGPAVYEMRSVIRFLNARNVLPSEVHHQICQVYWDNAMSDDMFMFKAPNLMLKIHCSL